MAIVETFAGRVFSKQGREGGWTELWWIWNDANGRIQALEYKQGSAPQLSDRVWGISIFRPSTNEVLTTRDVLGRESDSIPLTNFGLTMEEVVDDDGTIYHRPVDARLLGRWN